MANQHILKRDNGWGVKGEGNSRDTAILPTQQKAFERAREIAEKQGGDTIVHKINGQIGWRNTYGKYDPPQSKG